MDKKLILAVAGAGKTTKIVNGLNETKRSLVITYTDANCENLRKKIVKKFNGVWPNNIVLMTYFRFLYNFCYKPFLSYRYKAKGLTYEKNPNMFLRQQQNAYFISNQKKLYSNRLALLLERDNVVEDIKQRLEKYFDEFIIDEIQDIGGRDFNLLLAIMQANVDMLFVGDFYQHTYNTSNDGNTNSSLFDNYLSYKDKFEKNGFDVDETTLSKSWRCSPSVCKFVEDNLGIFIASHRCSADDKYVKYIEDNTEIQRIIDNKNIIKLHYNNSTKFGIGHRNWGDTKGEDDYDSVCILLNPTTFSHYIDNDLINLANSTKNKLYVAITRARGDVYLIEEKRIKI